MKKVEKTVQLGRPVNPNSARQIRLKELAEKKANGTLKLGRPVVEGSARQVRLAELEEKRANGTLQLGRPVNPNSARQKRLAELEAKRANGTLKRGRPAKQVEDIFSNNGEYSSKQGCFFNLITNLKLNNIGRNNQGYKNNDAISIYKRV